VPYRPEEAPTTLTDMPGVPDDTEAGQVDPALADLDDEAQVALSQDTAPGADGVDETSDNGPKSDEDAEVTKALPQEPGSAVDE
jgi:hypothetical protein